MVFRKRGLTLNRTLRATWLAGAGGAGAGVGYGWYESTKGGNYLKDRHISLAYDVSWSICFCASCGMRAC